MPNNLPQGWVECELKDIFETSSGGTPKRGVAEYYGGNIPWLKSGELNDGLIIDCEEYITEEGLKNSSAKLFPKGSLLIALYGATVGKLGVLDFDSSTNQAVCCIYENKNYSRNFLFYFLLSKKDYLINRGKGGAQPNISQEIIKSLIIPCPPFNEQRRIVEKIENEFEKIDKGIDYLTLTKEQIKQYCQSVLKSAFEGKLYKTTEWNNYELKDIFETSSGGTPKRGVAEYYDGDIPWLKSGELNDGLITNCEEYITEEGLRNSSAKLFPKGSILIALYGATVGKLGILDIDASTNQAICCIYENENYNRDFLFYYLLFKRKYLINQGKGGAQPNISQEIIKSLIIPFPLLSEQQQIVKEIEKRFKIADEVEKIVDENLEKAKRLKQSILKKAFEGKLVPQDPNDEQASVLLEKIKSEREKNERK